MKLLLRFKICFVMLVMTCNSQDPREGSSTTTTTTTLFQTTEAATTAADVFSGDVGSNFTDFQPTSIETTSEDSKNFAPVLTTTQATSTTIIPNTGSGNFVPVVTNTQSKFFTTTHTTSTTFFQTTPILMQSAVPTGPNNLSVVFHEILSKVNSQKTNFTQKYVAEATNVLSTFLNDTDEMISQDLLEDVTIAVSHLFADKFLSTDTSSRSTEIRSELLEVLNGFIKRVIFTPNNDFINVQTKEIHVQVKKLTAANRNKRSASPIQSLQFDLVDTRLSTNVTATIPSSSVEIIMMNAKGGDAAVFASLLANEVSVNGENTSQVLSLGVQNSAAAVEVNIEYENTTIAEKETNTTNRYKRRLNQARFVEWNFETLKWEPTPHCKETARSPAAYHCGAFASFAILFSSRIVPSVVALTVVSYIGSALSIISLLATIIIYLYYRELRQKSTTITLTNICVCLLAFYLIYAVGVGLTSPPALCNALTFLLHYFALASLSWMSMNAYEMYQAFTSLTNSFEKKKLWMFIGPYGVPFLLVMINFSLTVLYLDAYQDPNDPEDIFFESLYRSNFACWLQPPSFYWGFLLPVGLLLIYNYVVFGVLLKKVIFRKRQIVSTAKSASIQDRLLNAFAIITMMGLTWIFGYFLLAPVNVVYQEAMQWLFTLFNIFQGGIIFYLHCLRREKVRKVWLPCASKKSQASAVMNSSEVRAKEKKTGYFDYKSQQTTKTTSNV